MRHVSVVVLSLALSPTVFGEQKPGQPVISPPFGPGECVVACVPESKGGGGSGGVNLPGGAGGNVSGSGGVTGVKWTLPLRPVEEIF